MHAGNIAGVTRAVVLVEDQVPHVPALSPIIEVGDDALGEAQGGGPGAANTTFGVKEMFVREGIVNHANVIEVVAGIPVEGGSPDVPGSFAVVVRGLDPFVDKAAIVVPDHELDVGEAGFFKGGAQEILDEVAFFIGGEDAGFPGLGGESLILNRQAPYGNALGGVSLDVFYVVVGPGLVVFGLEFATMQHFAVGFHPAGRAPGRSIKLEVAPGGSLRAFDERDAVLAVVVDGEVLEFPVADGVIIGVHVAGVVAAVDRGAAEGITVAFNGIEAGFEELFLGVRGEPGEDGSGGIRKGATKTQDALEGLLVIDDDRGDVLVGLLERGEGKETAVG